ncbi:MAG TPA: hypothetical protein DD713_03325 [Nitrospiraceae bacterium]|nr:hypothetical protein [Nitrospiraceae bacterium]
MKFEDIVAEFGKPLHELNEEEVLAIAQQLNSTELERFEVKIKAATKTPRTQKVTKTGQANLDAFLKMKLDAKQGKL